MAETIDGGHTVVARVQRDLRGNSSGAEVDFEYWLVLTFRDGKSIRGQWLPDRDAALDAAGLSG